MRYPGILVMGLGLMAACGDSLQGPQDAAVPDAAVDAAGLDVLAVTAPDGSPVTTVPLAPTVVGQATSSTLRVTNHGTAPTGAIAISITGPAANDFTIDNQGTTCAAASLAPNASCNIVFVFRPTAAGAREATLIVVSGPAQPILVALSGSGVMSDLHFNPVTYSFGLHETGQGVQTSLEFRNDGSTPASIDSIVITGNGFTSGFNTCGASLAPSSSCDIVVAFSPQLGLQTGSLAVTSAGQVYSLPLDGRGARRITVARAGTGGGTITSSPSGISCAPDCSGLFESGVTLTAAPDAVSEITSWSVPGCGQAATCTITADVEPITVTVQFTAVGTGQFNVVVAGDAAGEVIVFRRSTPLNTLTSCFASCSIPVLPGDVVRIGATTASNLTGITGACAATSDVGECEFTATTGINTATVTFSKHAHEQWTRVFPDPVIGVAYDTAGNAIAATTVGLSKISPTGTTLWSRALPVKAVVAGPANTIYVVSGTDLKKLDSTSADVWTRPIPAGSQSTCLHQCLAVGADGSAAVSGATTSATRWAADGTEAWTKTMFAATGIAIDSLGIVSVARDTGSGLDARRFQPDGTELATFDRIGLEYQGEFAVDSNDALLSTTSGHGNVYRRRQAAPGAWTELGGYNGTFSAWADNGIAACAAGGAFVYFHYETDGSFGSQRHTVGGPSWSYTKVAPRIHLDASVTSVVGPTTADIAVGSDNHVVLGGGYRTPTFVGGFVQAYAP